MVDVRVAGVPEEAAQRDGATLGEDTLDRVSGVGASIAVTATRVVLIRESAHLRPRSGVRAWPHGELYVRLQPPRHGTGRLILGTDDAPAPVASIFIPADRWPAAEAVAAHIRLLGVRARRAAAEMEGATSASAAGQSS